MPVFRNINPNRQSGRLGSQTPVIYGPTNESINYLSNVGPLQRRPYVPSDEQYQSSTITSCSPSPRESHSRRREPGYIPRPRNAFIIFRSSYISGRASAGEGQQNELSKQAGKVWNRMTEDEKRPFVADANAEKKWHQATYPNYTYCPGRGAARRKGKTVTKNTKNTSGPTRRMSAMSSSSSTTSDSTFPEIPFTALVQRPPRAAAQRALEKFHQPPSISPPPCPISPTPTESLKLENMELSYPELNAFAGEEAYVPPSNSGVLKFTPIEEDALLRTAGPVLEPTPIKKEESEPHFDLTMQPPHLNLIPEQFGFKYHCDSAAMFAYLPPMPNANDDMTHAGDIPSLSSQLSPLSANPPDHSPAIQMMDDNALVFSPDGNITQDWPQSTIHYSDTPRMHVPGFAWSSYQENPHYAPIRSEEMWLEKDIAFMSSVFNFEVLQ